MSRLLSLPAPNLIWRRHMSTDALSGLDSWAWGQLANFIMTNRCILQMDKKAKFTKKTKKQLSLKTLSNTRGWDENIKPQLSDHLPSSPPPISQNGLVQGSGEWLMCRKRRHEAQCYVIANLSEVKCPHYAVLAANKCIRYRSLLTQQRRK